jgi:hypothetical protein
MIACTNHSVEHARLAWARLNVCKVEVGKGAHVFSRDPSNRSTIERVSVKRLLSMERTATMVIGSRRRWNIVEQIESDRLPTSDQRAAIF